MSVPQQVLRDKLDRISSTADIYKTVEKYLTQKIDELKEWLSKTTYDPTNKLLLQQDLTLIIQNYKQKIFEIRKVLLGDYYSDKLVDSKQQKLATKLKVAKKPLLQLEIEHVVEIEDVDRYSYYQKKITGSMAVLRILMNIEYDLNTFF